MSTTPTFTIRQLLTLQERRDLVLPALGMGGPRAGQLFAVVALALLDYTDPARGSAIVPVIRDHDGSFVPVTGALAKLFMPCCTRSAGEDYMDDRRAAYERMQNPLPKVAKARAIIAAAQARTPPA